MSFQRVLRRLTNLLAKVNLKIVVVGCGVGTVIVLIWGVIYFRQPIKVATDIKNLQIDHPVRVRFDHPVQSKISYNLSPTVRGEWKSTKNLFGITALEFKPESKFVPGSNYQLTIGNVQPLLANSPTIDSQTMPVSIEKPADIASITPRDKSTDIPTGTTVIIRLASPNHGLRQLRLAADAELISDRPESTDDTNFIWRFKQPLPQGHAIKLNVSDVEQTDKAKQVLLSTTFTTVAEPKVTATNRDHFYPGDKISITFDQNMEQVDSVFKFNFAGVGKWTDPKTYIFSPSGLKAGESYKYSVLKGAKSLIGGVLESDRNFTISPPGRVFVAGSSPKGSNVAVNSTISFTFDQPVDHATAEAAFSISPNLSGSFSWSGNTMNFKPSALDYQVGYTAKLAPGIKATYGLASSATFSNSFTTTYQVKKLSVPYFHQQYSLSCEEAALRMVLAFYGISASDADIVNRVGYAPRARDTGSNSWDNPYDMFVGDINGAQNSTGYGVYAGPIASAARSYGRSASNYTGVSSNFIASQIWAGHPVIVWGSSKAPRIDSWNTSSGVVQAWYNEHTRVVYGVAGRADAPVGFYLHDPGAGGANIYWSASQLMGNMNALGNLSNQAVVVN